MAARNIPSHAVKPQNKSVNLLKSQYKPKNIQPKTQKFSSKYSKMAFEGGGVLGITYVPAISKLEEYGIIEGIKYYSGASIGGIFAAVMACGGDSKFLNEKFENFKPDSLLESPSGLCHWLSYFRLLSYFGIDSGSALEKWLNNIFEELTGSSDITFSEAYDLTQKICIVNGTNINTLKTDYFSVGTTPDMKIVDALRITASYPGQFDPVKLLNNVYVDGGMSDNYPVRVLDKYPGEFIGIKLISDSEKKNVRFPSPDNAFSYAGRIITILHNNSMKHHVKESDWKNTIRIHTGDISPMEFDLTEEDKEFLINQAENAVDKYFFS